MGYELKTTNNRMELTAVIMALESELMMARIESSRIIIYTDSSYVANAYNKKWINNWKKNGWKNSKKEPVKNMDLWKRLDSWVSRGENVYTVEFVKVKGHSGVEGNEIADTLATTAIKQKPDEKVIIFIDNK